MAVGEQIRQTIKATQQTQQITKAMQMVAASKLMSRQQQMAKGRPYASHIRRVIEHMATATTQERHVYLETRPLKTIGYIVISTDRGLCGGLNLNMFRSLIADIKDKKAQGIQIELSVIGQKAIQFFVNHGLAVKASTSHMSDKPSVQDVIGVVKTMLDSYENGSCDALHIVYNRYVNTMIQKPVIQQLLPFPKSEKSNSDYWDYIYEPDAPGLMTLLCRRYIESQVYQAVVENIASEQAARMVAMQSATDNAGQLIDSLKLDYNKVRQAAITQEISEIVAGASS